MASGFGALCGDDIRAGRLRFLGMTHLAAHDDDEHAALVHLIDELGGNGEPGDEDADVLLEDDFDLGPDHIGDRR